MNNDRLTLAIATTDDADASIELGRPVIKRLELKREAVRAFRVASQLHAGSGPHSTITRVSC